MTEGTFFFFGVGISSILSITGWIDLILLCFFSSSEISDWFSSSLGYTMD